MDRDSLSNELNGILGDYLKSQGLELVELIYRREGQGQVLRVLADRPAGGISLGDCTWLNHQISRLLDEKGILEESYTLEVSSPGLDRPLKTKGDFLRCLNRKARFHLSEPINAKIELTGRINKVEVESVYIDTGDGVMEIPLAKLIKAKQVLE